MDSLTYNLIAPMMDDYIGDELTWEDLQKGYLAFLEDESSGSMQLVEAQTR